jgi:PKD repeat protein
MSRHFGQFVVGVCLIAGLTSCESETKEEVGVPAQAPAATPTEAAKVPDEEPMAAAPPTPNAAAKLPPEAATAVAAYARTPTPTDEEIAKMIIVWAESDVDFGEAPLTVKFSCEPLEGAVESPKYEWDFGDGSPKVSEEKPTHTYTKAGTYTATVTVTDAKGNRGTDTVEIEVEEPEAGESEAPNPA